jgi:hypothetical protein
MTQDRSLARPAPTAARARLADLEREVTAREAALEQETADLQALQTRYLAAVGDHYRQIVELDAAIIEAEIRAGLRAAPSDEGEEADAAGDAEDTGAGCGNRSAPSTDLKKMFRELAKTIHPDLAVNDPARLRRHSLMAEANRAYAERDEDRLRLILHHWQRTGEVPDDDQLGGDDEARVARRIARLEDRLLAIDAELADLRSSAIGQLRRKIDDARAQGWDLFAEMVLEVQREVRRAKARLAMATGVARPSSPVRRPGESTSPPSAKSR